MSSSDTDDFDPEAPDQSEIGREMVDQSTGLGSVTAHLYRGELSRVTSWRQRLDTSTNWAVTVIAGVFVYAFSGGASHAVLLAGMVTVTMFLSIEAQRYQDYDVFRARVRMMQQNLFANALDPSQGIERRDWRAVLSEDYRHPKIRTPYRRALRLRLRRVYLLLLVGLLIGWLFRIAVLTPGPVVRGATLGPIPGFVVIAIVGLFYLAAFAFTFWPREQSKGEFSETEYDEWQDTPD